MNKLLHKDNQKIRIFSKSRKERAEEHMANYYRLLRKIKKTQQKENTNE